MNRKLTYKDIEKVVEYLVKTKSYTYSFDCYEPADIAQEIRIICLKALKHFDVKRVDEDKWQNFFGRCVDNGLKNLKRDNYLRVTPPCKENECEYLHGDEHINSNLGRVCKKWLKFRKGIQRKLNIRHPIPIDLLGDIRDAKFEQEVEVKNLSAHLLVLIDNDLKKPFKYLLDGHPKKVSKANKERIREFMREYLDDE